MINKKNLSITSVMALLCLAMVFTACRKKPKGEITVTTNPVTNITNCSAVSGGTVSYTGAFTIGGRGICYGESPNPTVEDVYTKDYAGVGDFVSTIANLRPNTRYYVRAYANTSSGLIYGNQVDFSTKKEQWLYYGSSFNTYWGFTNGGTLSWGVMYPSEVLSAYAGLKITKVMVDAGLGGTYMLKMYEGGDNAPSNMVLNKSCTIIDGGEKTINIDEMELNASKNLWVTFSKTHSSGQYPAGSSVGKQNPNARWRSADGVEWMNTIANGWQDLCWRIKVFVTDEKKGEEYEIVLP